jgi:hypothetical protein
MSLQHQNKTRNGNEEDDRVDRVEMRKLRLYTPAHPSSLMASSGSALFVLYYHYTSTLLQASRLLSAKPRAQPARCLRSLLLDNGIELVRGRVDLLAGFVKLALGIGLGFLVLPLRVGAVGIEFLLGFLCFGLGLLGLVVLVWCCDVFQGTVDVHIAGRLSGRPRIPPRRPSSLPCPGLGSLPAFFALRSRHRLYNLSTCSTEYLSLEKRTLSLLLGKLRVTSRAVEVVSDATNGSDTSDLSESTSHGCCNGLFVWVDRLGLVGDQDCVTCE